MSKLLQALYVVRGSGTCVISESFCGIVLLFFLFPFPRGLGGSSLRGLQLLLLILL